MVPYLKLLCCMLGTLIRKRLSPVETIQEEAMMQELCVRW
jgi:hypothetical protein